MSYQQFPAAPYPHPAPPPPRSTFPGWLIALLATIAGFVLLCCCGGVLLLLLADTSEQDAAGDNAVERVDTDRDGQRPAPDNPAPQPEAGASEVQLPSVAGRNLADAAEELRQLGLVVVPVDAHPEHSGRPVTDERDWYVLAHCPDPGVTVTRGETVGVAVIREDEVDAAVRQAVSDGTLQAEIPC